MTRRSSSLLLALATLGLLPALAAADDGPIIIGRRERPAILTLDPFRGSVGVTGVYNMQTTSSGGQTARSTDTLFTEDLNLSSGGTVVSRNLLNWTGSATVSFDQEQSQAPGGNASQSGIFETYDFDANLLRNTQFPITAYARRSQDYINQAFAATLRDTITDYGATFRYNSPALPTSLSIGHTTTTQTDLGGKIQYTADSNHVEANTSFQPLDRQQVALSFSYNDNAQDNPNFLNQRFETEAFAASHTWGIDPDGRFLLAQGVGYSEQTGQFAARSLYWSEDLRAHWNEALESTVNYRLDDRQDTFSRYTSNTITAGLTHRLFQSLTTTARAGAEFTDNSFLTGPASSSSVETYFASVATNYNKKMWLGRLGADLSLGYTVSDNSAVTQEQQIVGEQHNFPDPQPIILTRPGINVGSITVFDAGGTRQFVKGADYTVRTVGNTVQLDRIVGGAIDADSAVRLNYLVDPLPGYTSRSTSFGAGLNYLFDQGPLSGLNLYTRYAQIDQAISPASSGIVANNLRDFIGGAEYHIWKLILRAEEEDRQSTLAPYNAQRFSIRYTDRLSDRTTLSLAGSQNFYQYPAQGNRTDLTSVDGNLAYQITRDLRATLSGQWRDSHDDQFGEIMGFEEQGDLRWKIRQTDLFLMIRHTDLQSNGGDSSSLMFQFGLTRHF